MQSLANSAKAVLFPTRTQEGVPREKHSKGRQAASQPSQHASSLELPQPHLPKQLAPDHPGFCLNKRPGSSLQNPITLHRFPALFSPNDHSDLYLTDYPYPQAPITLEARPLAWTDRNAGYRSRCALRPPTAQAPAPLRFPRLAFTLCSTKRLLLLPTWAAGRNHIPLCCHLAFLPSLHTTVVILKLGRQGYFTMGSDTQAHGSFSSPMRPIPLPQSLFCSLLSY